MEEDKIENSTISAQDREVQYPSTENSIESTAQENEQQTAAVVNVNESSQNQSFEKSNTDDNTTLVTGQSTESKISTPYNNNRGNTFSRPMGLGGGGAYRNREGGGYRPPQRYGDKKNDFYKDRDPRFKKFRKYDKIATKKLNIDYKDPLVLKDFLTEKGKIFSAAFTGNSAKNQRRLIREVKRARYVGLLPSA